MCAQWGGVHGGVRVHRGVHVCAVRVCMYGPWAHVHSGARVCQAGCRVHVACADVTVRYHVSDSGCQKHPSLTQALRETVLCVPKCLLCPPDILHMWPPHASVLPTPGLCLGSCCAAQTGGPHPCRELGWQDLHLPSRDPGPAHTAGGGVPRASCPAPHTGPTAGRLTGGSRPGRGGVEWV